MFAHKHLFKSKQAYDLELCSYKVLQGLLDRLEPLLVLNTEEFLRLVKDWDAIEKGKMVLEKKLFLLIPPKHLLAYQSDLEIHGKNLEPILRAHLIVDYISGMTDNHALHVYQLLSGISARVRA